MKRRASLERTTRETAIRVRLALDGSGRGVIDTGIGFFDHMLTALRAHAGLDLTVRAKGDLHVDSHHTVEDVGITLGRALRQALGDYGGIARYGFFLLPMDEALAQCALDLSGRAVLRFECPFARAKMGDMDTDLVEEFFRALSVNAGMTLHLTLQCGENDHHKAEALFKAFAHALRMAVRPTGGGILSTKGALDV